MKRMFPVDWPESCQGICISFGFFSMIISPTISHLKLTEGELHERSIHEGTSYLDSCTIISISRYEWAHTWFWPSVFYVCLVSSFKTKEKKRKEKAFEEFKKHVSFG